MNDEPTTIVELTDMLIGAIRKYPFANVGEKREMLAYFEDQVRTIIAETEEESSS